jgi:hypothetical protein
MYVKRVEKNGKFKIVEQRSWITTLDHSVSLNGWGLSAEQLLAEGAEICDGKIEARVEAEDEPYMGGSSAVLTITYTCEKCHGQHFPHLPEDSKSLGKFLTEVIEQMDDAPLIAAKTAQEKVDVDNRNAAMAKINADRAKRNQPPLGF